MRITDYKIRKLAKISSYPTSKASDQKIDTLLEKIAISEQLSNCEKKHYKKISFACWLLLCSIIVTFPAMATVNYIAKRMKKVPKSEQQAIYKEQQTSTGEEAILCSRHFTKEEQQRFDSLWNDYEKKGKLPSTELKKVKYTDKETEEYPVYVQDNRTILLPKRDLTDEELLQIIDYFHIADESLQRVNKHADGEIKDSEISNESLQQQLENKASAYLEKLTTFDRSKYTTQVSQSNGEGVYTDMYIIDFLYENDCHFEVCISSKNEQLLSISINENNEDYYAQSSPINDTMLEKAKKEVLSFYDDYTNTFVQEKSYIEYKINSDGNVPSGNINLYYVQKDGSAYCIKYNLISQKIWYIYLLDNIDEYKQAQEDKDDDYNREQGISIIEKPF